MDIITTLQRNLNNPSAFVKVLSDISKGHGVNSIDEVYQVIKRVDQSTRIPFARKSRTRSAIIEGWQPKFRVYVPAHDWTRVAENIMTAYGFYMDYAPYDETPRLPGQAFNALAHFMRSNAMQSCLNCFTYEHSILQTYAPPLSIMVACEMAGIDYDGEVAQKLLSKVQSHENWDTDAVVSTKDVAMAALNNDKTKLTSLLSNHSMQGLSVAEIVYSASAYFQPFDSLKLSAFEMLMDAAKQSKEK